MSSVCCARFSRLVKATSTLMPSFHIAVAPAAASFLPSVVSSTSAQPVKRLASFHTDCPWRKKMIVACGSAMHTCDAAGRTADRVPSGAAGDSEYATAPSVSASIVAGCRCRVMTREGPSRVSPAEGEHRSAARPAAPPTQRKQVLLTL